MRKIIILLTLSLTVIYTNAQTEKSIQQITQEVMERASIQYTNMASTLEKIESHAVSQKQTHHFRYLLVV